MTEGLLRQRRNLILSSLVILVLSFGNASINEISFAGINLSFKENLEFAYKLIWMVWGYFLYRYFIYFMEEAGVELKKYWKREFEKVVGAYIKKKVYEKYDRPNDGCSYSYYLAKKNGMVYSGQVLVEKYNKADNSSVDYVEKITLPLNKLEVFVYQTLALMKFIFLTPAVTDYLFAFLFSFVVVMVSEVSGWPGSLGNIYT